jgi:hypothetical protein
MSEKEPVIQDKIHLLMEETGCDQGEAELALASAGYDLEKAVRTIHSLLRHIVVIKGRFQISSRSLYGLLLVIVDTHRQSLHRLRAVVSYNPALFEESLEGDWYDFEKSLYAFRLGEGTLQQISQDLERLLSERWGDVERTRFVDWTRHGDMKRLSESAHRLLSAAFSGAGAGLDLSREELNLDQFRRLGPHSPLPSPAVSAGSGESLILKVSLEESPEGVLAREVAAGDTARAFLTDDRDVAQYLSKLLGGRSPEGLKALPAPVESVTDEGATLRFQLRLSGLILGIAHADPGARLKVDRLESDPWWRRLPFLGK